MKKIVLLAIVVYLITGLSSFCLAENICVCVGRSSNACGNGGSGGDKGQIVRNIPDTRLHEYVLMEGVLLVTSNGSFYSTQTGWACIR